MTIPGRVTIGSLAVLAGLLATRSIRRRRGSTRDSPATHGEVGWDVSDDVTQAAANALPHESGAFSRPPRPPNQQANP